MGLITVRKRPCGTCPYRLDVPSAIWNAADYAKLGRYDGDVPDQIAAGATKLFDCHLRSGELCAGWVGCHDMLNSLAIRLAAMEGDEIDPAVFQYGSPVPLFPTGAAAAAHGMRDIEAPGPAARRKIAGLIRLARVRAAREGGAARS